MQSGAQLQELALNKQFSGSNLPKAPLPSLTREYLFNEMTINELLVYMDKGGKEVVILNENDTVQTAIQV